MIRTKLDPTILEAVRDIQRMITSNHMTIEKLSERNQELRTKMFKLASNDNPELTKDAIITGDELITFEKPKERYAFGLNQLKEIAVTDKNFELAADLRDIEKKYEFKK